MLPSDGGVHTGATGRRQAHHMTLESWFVLLLHSKWTWNNINYLYKLKTTSEVVPQVVYGLLPTMEKVADIIGITWHTSLYHITENCCQNVLSACKLLRTQHMLQFGKQIVLTWTKFKRTGKVPQNFSTSVLASILNSVHWVGCSIIIYDTAVFKQVWTFLPNCNM